MATVLQRITRVPVWVAAIFPLAVIGVMVGLFVAFNPISDLHEVPPVEELAVERTTFDAGEIELRVRNDGPDPVRIAQVLVNEAYWSFGTSDADLDRLESATLRIPYPWEEGLPVSIGIVTSTGVVIGHEVEAAALSPDVDAKVLTTLALLGLYIGVVPVAVGLLWFSSVRRASPAWLAFVLALTVGLLVFLLIDTVVEGLELAAVAPQALDGIGLFFIGALVAVAALLGLEQVLSRRKEAASATLVLSYLVASGIGLHNLGEGLAVGAAVAAGEVALGTFLVVGFALHNTTEGLAIVAPVAQERKRPSMWHFVALGALAGVPTIAGAWIGGLAFNPAWAALAFGAAAGAIAQVVWTIARSMGRGAGLATSPAVLGFLAGLAVMYATGLFTA